MENLDYINEEIIQTHINNIQENGFTIIRNAFDDKLADDVVNDFNTWSNLNEFDSNMFNRVTNFHTLNKNTLDLATNKIVDRILVKLFGKQQCVYSSLFFREGTAQHFHVDTPHFFTNPINQYYGVWFALEDIDKNAGPLKYYIKSHKIETQYGYDIVNKLFPNKKTITNEENLECLLYYNKLLEDKANENNLIKVDENNYLYKINKGDIIIWHPNLLHGGSNILDNKLTRHSMVTHNVPIGTQVFNASHFFSNKPTQEYIQNKCGFVYKYHNNIPFVHHDVLPRVQKNYI
jgi:phytanoyl-CoA hydroxylase